MLSNNGYDIILMLPETLSEGDDYYNMQSEMVKSSADTYNYIFLSLASMLVLAMVSVYLIYAAGETAGPEKSNFRFSTSFRRTCISFWLPLLRGREFTEF